jgi:hypothetical protein
VVRAISPIGWGSATFPIEAMDQDKRTITLGGGGWQIGDSAPFKGTPFYVEGIKEELDAPWEWVVDAEAGLLYFFPNQTMPPPPPPPPAFVIVATSLAATACSLNGATQGCCVDLQFYNKAVGAKFAADNCHPTARGENQFFTYNDVSHVLTNTLSGHCLSGSTATVTAEICNPSSPNQQWVWTGGALKNGVGCLSGASSPLHDGTGLVVAPCTGAGDQMWALEQCATPSCLPNTSAVPAPDVAGVVPPPTLTEAVVLKTIVRFEGTVGAPVQNVQFSGVRFAHSATTQLERYEVPSGGDWSVYRGAAVEVQDAENIAVADSFFDSVGGNAVLLSRHAVNCTVSGNRISFPGDSGIVLLGISNMADGTAPTFPAANTIENNFIHDIGRCASREFCLLPFAGPSIPVR